jgi:polysaccharide export outer membrane protein
MASAGDIAMALKLNTSIRLATASLSLLLFFTLKAASAEETVTTQPMSDKVTQPINETKVKSPAPEIKITDKDYAIQAGDLLEISVWKERDLMKDVLVRPDGEINFPLVGNMVAAGKSVEQLQQELTTKLSKYVPDPSVSIAIKQTQGYKIYVIGKVARPGEIVTNRNMDVMQALSIAGSPTPFASVNNIKILRRDKDGKVISIPFKFSSVEKGKDLEQNIILRSGDTVVVP